jgi:hypothetical protein
MLSDDEPNFIAIIKPVAAEERVLDSAPRERRAFALPHDLGFPGGTAYLLTSSVMDGEPPAPWNAPVAHANRLVAGAAIYSASPPHHPA